MAGREIADFEQLLRELGRARSLRARLRVLGHAWGLLRRLPRAKREEVALRLGSDWAWKRVERAFLSDGELSESERLVGHVFGRLQDSDPTELRALAARLKEGGPEGARDLLLMTLTEALEEEADEGEEEAGAEGEAAQEPPMAPPPARLEVVADAGAVLASTLAQRIRAHGPEEPETPPEPVAPSRPAPPEPRPEARPARPEVRPETRPAPPEPRPAPPAPEPAPPAPPTTTAPAPPKTALAVLRQLTRSERPGAELGRAGRERLLESLGGGWASRRALSRMIAARSLDDLDEALGLVRGLAGPSQRSWCLADLLAHWPLGAGELDRVLEAAPSEAARRRLERRWQRGRPALS